MVFLSFGFGEHFQSNGYSPLEHSILAPWPLIFFSFMKKRQNIAEIMSRVKVYWPFVDPYNLQSREWCHQNPSFYRYGSRTPFRTSSWKKQS